MKAAQVIARLRAGDKLHMQIAEGRRVWWFENPHANVCDAVVSGVLKADRTLLRETGDSLFGLPLNSQTWVQEGGDGS